MSCSPSRPALPWARCSSACPWRRLTSERGTDHPFAALQRFRQLLEMLETSLTARAPFRR
jgi:hypothetical protein